MSLFDFLEEQWNSWTVKDKVIIGASIVTVFAPYLAIVIAVVALALYCASTVRKYIEMK